MTAPKLKIGMITGEYPPMQGGIGAYTRILSRKLAAQGGDVFVLSRSGAVGSDQSVKLSANIDRWNAGSLRAARKWARDLHLDVVNVQYQTAAFDMSPFIYFLPDALRPIPVVTTFHDLRYPYLFPKAGRLRDWIVMRLARASHGVIATNHEDAARLRDLCMALIPIGSNITVSHSNPAEWRANANAAGGNFLIANFGLINRSKGVDTLIESLARLRNEGVRARLVLIGGVAGSSDPTNAAYVEEVDRAIDRLDLAAFVHRTGYLDDAAVSGYLRAADVVVLPFRDGASYRRGSLMAAIQHGGAIVTTQPQVEISTFADGENMLLVPPNDAQALTMALRKLYESPERRARLERGAAALSSEFDWDQIAQATLNFYHRVIGVSV